MKWTRVNDQYLKSECGKWHITKAEMLRGPVYQLIRLGKRKGHGDREFWEGSESVCVGSLEECKAAVE